MGGIKAGSYFAKDEHTVSDTYTICLFVLTSQGLSQETTM